METQSVVIKRWDDLVFENRNKDYGAYAIRRHYSENVNKGFALAIGIVAMLAAIPILAGYLTSTPLPELPGNKDKIIICQITPTIKPEPRVQSIARRTPPTHPTFTITSSTVDEPEDVTPNELIDANNSNEGVDDGAIVTATGNQVIDIPSVEPPAPPAPPRVFDHTEVMPTFKGGQEAMIRYFQRNLRYPAIDRRLGNQGKVFVSFVVGADGSIIDVKLIRGISQDCDAEAQRVIAAMPKWNAGQQNGNNVMVRMVLPINFQIDPNY